MQQTPAQDAARFRTRALLGLCAGLGVACAAVAYLGISKHELIASIHGVDPGPLFVAAAGALVLLGLQSLRWWVVMRPLLDLTYAQAYRAMAVGFFFNVLLPARGGDLLRVQYLGKRTGVSRAKLLGTEIVDFWSDKWGWVAAFPIVCLFGTPPAWLFRALLLIGFAVVSVGAVLGLMGSGLWRSARLPRFVENLRDGFAVNHWKRLLAIETLIAPLPWLWETLVIALAGHALGLHLSPMQAFAALTAFNVATAVPSPGNAGSFEAGGTLALAAFGIDKETALAFIFLYHLTQVVPGFLSGLLVLVFEGEHLFGRAGVFRLRTPDLALNGSAVPEP
ncbi:MAG TPA: lysylphosphatidylglycerol synthase transmembrane domain-containing protein, partial [Myxococcales bacterium]|nr:lysylphosphatidylglycerol synthase transmembrane domain-containing protein [Myxococcales bacterium]